ncbi:MAG: PEP-CTERM sorting domain-containing protein [Syntrophales bacterium]
MYGANGEIRTVPEPSSFLLIGLGLAGLAGVGRKFKK